MVGLLTLIETLKNLFLVDILGSYSLLVLFIIFFFGVLILVHKGKLPLIAVIFTPLILLFSGKSFIVSTITPIFSDSFVIMLAMIIAILITILYFKLFK